MAETAVGSVIDKLIPLLTEEAKLLRGVHAEVSDIQRELKSIQSVLKEADKRAATKTEEDVTDWVKELREVAFHIEDVIDEYLQHVAKRPRHRGFIGFLRKIARLIKNLKPRHEIASEIQEIKASVQKIKERKDGYGFGASSEQGSSRIGAWKDRWNDPRLASLYLEEAEVVGIEAPRNELIGLLVEGPSHRTVISVVGMGGMGKTTLAKKVYDHKVVRNHFDCHAWISVSQLYRTEDLLKSMIKKFCEARMEFPPESVDTMEMESLIDKIRKYLKDKRYVVVFDDVWEEKFWREIEHALLDTKKGSRIMITTRKVNVANFCKTSSSGFIHELQALAPNNAWELFCKKVFQFDSDWNCPSNLKKLSHAILERCQGLPLAIVTVGGLLSTKDKNFYEWKKLCDNLATELGDSGVREILSLSYYDLPYYLKSCFLYFGMYPEDYSINCARLIRKWIAEGFVKEKKGKTLEEVAQEYLTELIHRSLVQVSRVNIDGKARTCQLHDLLREIVLQKMEDLNFCHVFSEGKSSFNGLTRRLSINAYPYEVLTRFENSHVRSILFFLVDVLPKSSMDTIVAKFKLLKVLDFENGPLNHVPKDLGNLFHLRYLSLRNTEVKLLPKSIGNLQNLETLDLKQSLVCEIPVEIIKLKKLRYLVAYYRDYNKAFSLTWGKGVKIHEGIGSLEALQKLYYVDVDHGGMGLIEELKKLKQLRKLGIKNLKKETEKALCAAIEQMNQLESLNIRSISEDEIIDFQSISSPPQYLRHLSIKGRLDKLPDWISKHQNLVRLGLFWSRLRDDPLKTLQNLPNLLELTISHRAYDGLQMHFEEGGFPKLKELVIAHMNKLESMIIDNGALPFLKVLDFGPFPQLKEMPSDIQHLINLKSLFFNDMPRKFEERLDQYKGRYYWFIQHVPAVYIVNRVSARHADVKIRNLRSSISKVGSPSPGFILSWKNRQKVWGSK